MMILISLLYKSSHLEEKKAEERRYMAASRPHANVVSEEYCNKRFQITRMTYHWVPPIDPPI
jgi:hypothetical protein